MNSFRLLLLLLAGLPQLNAREIDIRLWISGGMQGVVMGNHVCPGWLSVARQLAVEDPGGCWIQVGALPFTGEIEGLKRADVVVPRESDFRLQGLSALEKSDSPWSLLNVKALPQFPEYQPAFAPLQVWRQADGVEVHVFGLLSDQAPLRIPPDRLRPLQVTPALQSLRQYLTEHPLPENAIPVLVLPEEADAAAWSAWLPEFPLLIQSAGTQAKVIALQNGAQLRLQPARYGRAIIRVQLYWDTVSKRFRNPTAETVWVQAPDLHGVDIPDALVSRIKPLEESAQADWVGRLMRYGDVALLPELHPLEIDSQLPDALRVAAFPEDQAWGRVEVDKAVWTRWQAAWEGTSLDVRPDDHRGELLLLLPARAAAGNGAWASVIRKDLADLDLEIEWMPFSSRDLLYPLTQGAP